MRCGTAELVLPARHLISEPGFMILVLMIPLPAACLAREARCAEFSLVQDPN